MQVLCAGGEIAQDNFWNSEHRTSHKTRIARHVQKKRFLLDRLVFFMQSFEM